MRDFMRFTFTKAGSRIGMPVSLTRFTAETALAVPLIVRANHHLLERSYLFNDTAGLAFLRLCSFTLPFVAIPELLKIYG